MRWTLLGMVALVAVGCAEPLPPEPPPFSLDAPASLKLLEADTNTLDVAVTWNRDEREDLALAVSLEPADRGVSATAAKPQLPRGAGPAQVTLTATETAAPGEYELTIKAKGVTSGKTAETKVKVVLPRGD